MKKERIKGRKEKKRKENKRKGKQERKKEMKKERKKERKKDEFYDFAQKWWGKSESSLKFGKLWIKNTLLDSQGVFFQSDKRATMRDVQVATKSGHLQTSR